MKLLRTHSGALIVLFAAVSGIAAPWLPSGALGATSEFVTITEIMPYPEMSDEIAGQWIELQNKTDSAINLQGMVLMTSSFDGFHAISRSAELILEPGAIVLLGARLEQDQNGGAPVSYSYGSDVQLNLESDIVFLMKNNNLIDYVTYGNAAIQVEKGFSISREPEGTIPNWCLARRTFGLGDHGTPGAENNSCDDDGDTYSEDEGDCDDSNFAVRPDGFESCNGLDENCNDITDEDVTPPAGICPSKGVCAAIIPQCNGAAGFSCPDVAGWEPDGETLCDNLDNDCDGLTDELLRFNGNPLGTACTAPGDCGQGVVVCSVMTARPTCSTLPDGTNPGSSTEKCDGRDNDCDGLTDEGFSVGETCGEGLGTCGRAGVVECSETGTAVCGAVPGQPGTELCGDRLDNDCDGDTDEGFGVGAICSRGTGACLAYSRFICATDMLDITCPAVEAEPSDEICGDLIDNDCNGDTDEYGCIQASGGCSSNTAAQSPWGVLLPMTILTLASVLFRMRFRRH